MEEQKWINFIDERIHKYLNSRNYIQRFPAIVTGTESNKYLCRILPYDTIMPFLNKSGETISVGDNVFIETPSNSLTNGVIAFKFGS